WDDVTVIAQAQRADGLLADASHGRREMLGTSMLAAVPEQVIRLSHPTWLPLMAALTVALMLAGFLAKAYWLASLALVPLIALFGCWLWTTGDRDAPTATDAGGGLVLPTQLAARNAPGWWALVISLLLDGSL